jgi:uncharacterized delta-60 repeat protein/uncharacterized repeat protein (TIGR01451 family)
MMRKFYRTMLRSGSVLLPLVLVLAVLPAPAAWAFSVDDGFNPGADDVIIGVTVQRDGKILVGGAFTQLGGQPRQRIGRLNPDGTLDSAFDPGANGTVYILVVLPDDKILVGGMFTQLGGQPCPYLGRLLPDGTLDTTFQPGANGWVFALALQPDGDIVVGGFFTQLGGQPRARLGRLHPDGTLDAAFDPGANAGVDFLVLQPDGKVLAGGWFTQLGGQPRNYIGRLNADGTLDESFNPGTDNYVYSLALQADGKVLVGGEFTQLGGQPRDHIGRLLPDGTLDDTFTSGADSWVNTVAVQPDGSVLVGGDFSTLGGGSRARLGRLLPDGSLDATFTPGADLQVFTLIVQPDDKILAVGEFTQLGGQARGCIGRLYPDGSLDNTLNPGANNWVRTVTLQADGKILAGGSFTTLGAQTRNRIGRINLDGSLDTTFDPGADNWVYVLVVQPDNKILVGGYFSVLDGQSCSRIGRLLPDGSLDTTFDPVANGAVVALALQPDGDIVVGGYFTSLGGQARNYIGRIHADGTLDTTFNPGANGTVLSVALQPDGKIVLGGDFTTLGGQARSHIGRLNPDGTLDESFNPGASSTVGSLLVQPDDKILVGGNFGSLGGQARSRIGRLNPNGSLDLIFNPGANDTVAEIVLQAGGYILVGGNFTTLGGQTRSRIGRLNSDGTVDPTFNPGANTSVYGMAVQADGKIVVGGWFTSLGGQARAYIGRLSSDTFTSQELAAHPNGTAVSWIRGGPGPEPWRTTLELSTDGITYTLLGEGVRVPGGWQLTGLSLPREQNLFLRARGFCSVGSYVSSGMIVESRRNVYLHAADLVLTKAVTPTLATPGAPITYTLAFQNDSLGPALSIVLTDVLPVEITATAIVSGGVAITATAPGVWAIQEMAPGQSGWMTVTGLLREGLPGGHVFTNTAAITTPFEAWAGDNHATVTVTVASVAPVAVGDSYTGTEDFPLPVAAPGVLANDSDRNGDDLAVTLDTPPVNGVLALSADGSFVYTPTANWNGTDAFTYTVSDGALTDTARALLNVAAVNDAPFARDDAYMTIKNTLLVVPAPGVLANDDDIEGDPLHTTLLDWPAHGAVGLNADGSFLYMPALGWSGLDVFTYATWDDTLSGTASVWITVTASNNPPVAEDDYATTAEDTPANLAVLTNDSDPESAPLALADVSMPAHGTAVISGSITVLYTPDPDYYGPDSFDYVVSDGSLTDTATVWITVTAVNDAPQAQDDYAQTLVDSPVRIAVLANDSDVDNDPLILAAIGIPAHGSAVISDGAALYTPTAGFEGSDTFTYTVSDGALYAGAVVTVNVVPRPTGYSIYLPLTVVSKSRL